MQIQRPDAREIRQRIETTILNRVSPERTRRATMTERLTVSLMPWQRLVVVNRVLEIVGKIATFVWFTTITAIILGFDMRDAVSGAFNSGRPIEGIFAITILVPTVIFLLIRSAVGYCRWRVQRELWRRDVRRLSRLARDAGASIEEAEPKRSMVDILKEASANVAARSGRGASGAGDDKADSADSASDWDADNGPSGTGVDEPDASTPPHAVDDGA